MNILVSKGAGQDEIVAVENRLTIGRDQENLLVVTDPRVSRTHVSIEKKNGVFHLKDLDSSNGTYVNGRLVAECDLTIGDEIVLGSTRLKVLPDDFMPHASLQEQVRIVTEEKDQAMITKSLDSKKSTYMDLEKQKLKLDQFEKTVKNLSILYKSGNLINAILNEQELLSKVLDLVMEVIKADRYVVLFRDEKTKEFVPKIIRRAKEQAGFYPIAISSTIVDTVVNEKVGVICAHAPQDERFTGSESILIYGIKSAMCVPIELKNKITGLIYCDSLNRMGQFTEDDLKLLSAIAMQAAVALENARLYHEVRDQERLRHELLIAREIQQILFPRNFPQIEKLELCFRSITAEEVGGDYYDWFWIDKNRLAVVIADVSGKGVPGALVMAMFRSTLKSRAITAQSTAELLTEVNNLMMPDIKQDMFISAILAFVDISARTLSFSRAGHLPLMIYRKSEDSIEESCPKGLALGFSTLAPGGIFEERKIELNTGDSVIFYTDGVIEAQNPKKEVFGSERLKDFLCENLSKHSEDSASLLIEKTVQQINAYVKNEPQSDDITLGFLKVK